MKVQQFLIYGRVQGVGFRFFTLREAKRIGIVGYVRNRQDNSVQIIAQGTDAQLAQLAQWLKKGSPMAKVERILIQDYSNKQQFRDFQIIH